MVANVLNPMQRVRGGRGDQEQRQRKRPSSLWYLGDVDGPQRRDAGEMRGQTDWRDAGSGEMRGQTDLEFLVEKTLNRSDPKDA